jgi:hypothetical protein
MFVTPVFNVLLVHYIRAAATEDIYLEHLDLRPGFDPLRYRYRRFVKASFRIYCRVSHRLGRPGDLVPKGASAPDPLGFPFSVRMI